MVSGASAVVPRLSMPVPSEVSAVGRQGHDRAAADAAGGGHTQRDQQVAAVGHPHRQRGDAAAGRDARAGAAEGRA
jgi:hypothetical protein